MGKILKRIIFALVITFALISAVSAAEDNTTYLTSASFNDITSISENTTIISFDKNYTTSEDLVITQSTEIYGNNHYIIRNDDKSIFEIQNQNITLTFNNVSFKTDNVVNDTRPNITFMDCKFNIPNILPNIIVPFSYYTNITYSEPLSDNITQLAISIVNNTTGIAAAEKLALWVCANITHERMEGFYQTPDTTVLRGKGNCCSQTDLFLKLCEAVGLTEEYDAYYVHIGNVNYGKRHFCAVIGNYCVDFDAFPENPWGYINFKVGNIFNITKYPLLPIPKNILDLDELYELVDKLTNQTKNNDKITNETFETDCFVD